MAAHALKGSLFHASFTGIAAGGGPLTDGEAVARQRLALVVARVVDGNGEAVEDVDVRLIRCRGRRRFTSVPSFEPANPTGVPLESDQEGCEVLRQTTDDEGLATFLNVRVGDAAISAARDARVSYLVRTVKEGYTSVRRLITPHVARNDLELTIYRTAGERMFELVAEAREAADVGDFAVAEAAMIQSIAMMRAELAVRGSETSEVLLESLRYLAWVQLRADNDIAAALTLDELLQLVPEDAYGLRTAGFVAVQRRDWRTAEARFASYLLFHPGNADAHLMMGNLTLETGNPGGAVEHLEAAVDLDPELTIAYRSLGTAYEQSGRLREAVASFERYLELAGEPTDAAQIRATIAMLRR